LLDVSRTVDCCCEATFDFFAPVERGAAGINADDNDDEDADADNDELADPFAASCDAYLRLGGWLANSAAEEEVLEALPSADIDVKTVGAVASRARRSAKCLGNP
jgi:hypothetical protein